MSYVAECEQCGVLERGDLEAVGDAAEDHERFHDVRVERVATDGGSRLRCASCRATVTLDDTLELQAPEISDGAIARVRVCEDCRPDTGNKRPVTAYKDLLKAIIKRANGVEQEQATLGEDEWNPETADLRNGETTDVDSHTRRNAEQLRMAEENLEDGDNLVTDGGQDVRSEWTLVCTDCDWEDELVADGHPRDGPPSEVENRVRKHKGTVDWSHVVRVEGRVADEDREIDPSLLTDGGQSVDATERPGHPGWICTKCAKLVSSRPFGRCHDCGGIFCEATREDALCDRCGDSEGNRLLDRSGDYDRLCESCIQYLDLRTRRSWDTDTNSEFITDGGVQRWHYKGATSARSLAGVGTQNHCRNGTRGCPGPDAGGGELPCSACFLQGGDADA